MDPPKILYQKKNAKLTNQAFGRPGYINQKPSQPPEEMQKSAAEARNKNRSGLCFDYQPSAREVTKTAPKKAAVTKGGAAKKEAKPVEKAVSSEKPGLMELEFGEGREGCLN